MRTEVKNKRFNPEGLGIKRFFKIYFFLKILGKLKEILNPEQNLEISYI